MEIFRIDGGGRTENPPRLIKVIGEVMNRIIPTSPIWKNIKSIKDEKGVLTIIFFKNLSDSLTETFIAYLFMREWDKMGETPDKVYIFKEGEEPFYD